MTKINLRNIAATVSKMDPAAGRNEDIIAAQTVLANFAKLLRAMSSEQAFAAINALLARGGKRKSKEKCYAEKTNEDYPKIPRRIC